MSFELDLLKLKDEDPVSYGFVKASWLQKCIRRGLVDKAVALARLYIKEGQSGGLQRKLLVFCYEDIGQGTPHMNLLLKNEPDLLKQTELLALAYKNRENDRFLLAVRDFSQDLLKNKEIYKEVASLQVLLSIADKWFSNKRDKIAKQELMDTIEMFRNKATEDGKEIIDQAIEDYLLLSKHKSFGARTALAHIVLTSLRQNNKTDFIAPSVYSLPNITLPLVDNFALDKHTSFGKKLGKKEEDWYKEGAVINNERTYPELYLRNGEEKYPYELWISN